MIIFSGEKKNCDSAEEMSGNRNNYKHEVVLQRKFNCRMEAVDSYQFVSKSSRGFSLIIVQSEPTMRSIEAATVREKSMPCTRQRYVTACLQNWVLHTGLYSDSNRYNEGFRRISYEIERIIILLQKNSGEIRETWEIVTNLISFSRKQNRTDCKILMKSLFKGITYSL